MSRTFNRNAYGRPPAKVVIQANKSLVDESKRQNEKQSNSGHELLSVANAESVYNGSAVNTPLKQDVPEPEAFAVQAPTQSQQPTADTYLADKKTISPTHTSLNKTPQLSLQENTSVCVIEKVENPGAPSSPPKENINKPLLLVQALPASEKQSQQTLTWVKAAGSKHLQDTQIDGSGNLSAARSNSNSRGMSKMDKSDQAVARSDHLKQLQDASLRKITRKSAARKNKDLNNTVSMRDLDLARTPVNTNEPQTSLRTWAKDAPLYQDGCDFESGTPLISQIDFPVATQDPSTRASNKQTMVPEPALTQRGRSKWAAKDEMKAETAETNSNQWGSAAPSDATHSSNVADESFGKLLRNREHVPDEKIDDWEGKLLPPPADWAERTRYNNNNQGFKDQFKHYIRDLQGHGRFSNGIPIKVVPYTLLLKDDYHPDGIGMVPRTTTVNINTAARYGYTYQPDEAIQDAQAIEDSAYEASCPLHLSDEANFQFDRNETTHTLVTNWNRHIANSRGEPVDAEDSSSKPAIVGNKVESSKPKSASVHEDVKPKKVELETTKEPLISSADEEEEQAECLTQPKLNIYLRPGTQADLSELTRIYNWYLANSNQPAELNEISEPDMQSRMNFCETSKLPFIVAACKSQKGTKPVPRVDDEETSRGGRLPVTHKQPLRLTRIENLAGFCCANDFSAPDYIEHISADIEIYVDAQYRRMGVGKCLMDKMLEICDRGHRLSMDVPFHCDREIRHMYGPGGVRDIHKVWIQQRKWHIPKAATVNVSGQRKSKKLAFAKLQENNYAQWLKKWFESLGFEEEGYLRRVGAKNGRYVDLVYLGRETSWRPAEGKVPDPAPGFMVEFDDGQ